MDNTKTTAGRPYASRNAAVSAVAAACALLSPVASAGLLEISYTTSVESFVTGEVENVTGQFILDTNAPWIVDDTSTGNGVIASGSFSGDTLSGEIDTDSGFTFGLSGFSSGTGWVELVGDIGFTVFSLQLTSDSFFQSNNVFDSLIAGMTLDDFDPFDPSAVVSTRFRFVSPDFQLFDAALTSLSIRDLTAIDISPTFWLVLVGLVGLSVSRPRLMAVAATQK